MLRSYDVNSLQSNIREAYEAIVECVPRTPKGPHLTQAHYSLIIIAMTRICTVLVLLLLVFTFNAYACVLPLQPESAGNCSTNTDQPVRQTCDAFIQLGPQSPPSSSVQELPLLSMDVEAAPQLPISVFAIFRSEHPPLGADTPIHLSIPTTVLRI